MLAALIDVHADAGDLAAAADVARRLVDLDPVNEAAHRQLIVAYARAGQRGHALRQYLACRRALVAELGVEPGEETAALQRRVLAGEPCERDVSAPPSFPVVGPRRTYVVSLYDADETIVVEAVQRDERARLEDLDGLPGRIREWEDEDRESSRSDAGSTDAG